MKILVMSKIGEGLGLAYKMQSEGHNVSVFIKEPGYEFSGLGIIERVASWRPTLNDIDFAICDSTGFGKYVDVFKQFNVPIIGCNKIGDMLDEDPAKTNDICKRADIKIPDTWQLSEPSAGVTLMENWPSSGVVVKSTSKVGEKQTTFCSDPQSYFWVLSKYSPDTKVTVQERVGGTHVTVEGWFNGIKWLSPFFLAFKETDYMVDKGVFNITGTAIVRRSKSSKLIMESLVKLTPFLISIGYKGAFGIDFIINKDGAYATKVRPKISYDSIEAMIEGMTIPLTEFFDNLLKSSDDKIHLKKDHNYIAVRLSTPVSVNKADMPIVGVNGHNERHMFLQHVYKDKDKDIKFAGDDSNIAKIVAYGSDMKEARNRVYRTINRITFIDKRYNPSVGLRVTQDLIDLRKMGYIIS